MTLPSFLTRIHNAAGPLLDGIAESELGERLASASVVIEIDEARASDPGHRAAYRLAVNLAARLYPRLALEAPADLASEARDLALSINPGCELGSPGDLPLRLSLGAAEPSPERVVVSASGWSLSVDEACPDEMAPAMPPAAMAAAALGVGELFRALFADRLAHGRSEPSPFALNLLSLGEDVDAPPLPEEIEIGSVHLAGCGAVGQAAAATLRELPVSGTLYAVDHEPLDEGNLQRYLLSGQEDVGTSKPTLIVRAFEGHLLTVEPVPTRWGADSRSAPGREPCSPLSTRSRAESSCRQACLAKPSTPGPSPRTSVYPDTRPSGWTPASPAWGGPAEHSRAKASGSPRRSARVS